MAVSTKLIHVRPNPRLNTFRPFSSSSTAPTSPPHSDDKPSEPGSRSHLNSYFSDVKSTLKQSQQFNPPFRPITSPPPNSSISPPKLPSLDEIGKTLSGFRHRSVSPPHGSQLPSPGTPIQFQDILQGNANSRPQGLSSFNEGKTIGFNNIRDSLNKFSLHPTNPKINSSISEYQKTLKLRPSIDRSTNESLPVIGGTNAFPFAMFEKESKEKGGAEYIPEMKTEFVKYYSVRDLGEKLRSLRPETKGDKKDWFSLEELNQRLVKLREMDLQVDVGNNFDKLKFAFRTMGDDHEKKKKLQRLNTLGHFGRTPTFMLKPPQEELVEKFFHPDNMSASEKLKLQLEIVREEFKMSETDCGSSRVQVAQLTTKINHLAGVLHKKDKHSRKGLQAMLQKRKSLLKYLRRTDWESYCFVLSRLGLRDNSDAKR